MFLGSQDAAEEAKRQCEHGFRLRESEDDLTVTSLEGNHPQMAQQKHVSAISQLT